MEDCENGDARVVDNEEDRVWEAVEKGTSDGLEYLWVLERVADNRLNHSIN